MTNQCDTCAMSMWNRDRLVCKALSSTRFKNNGCPFHKTPEQMQASESRAYKRLVKLGREDLIERYFVEPV